MLSKKANHTVESDGLLTLLTEAPEDFVCNLYYKLVSCRIRYRRLEHSALNGVKKVFNFEQRIESLLNDLEALERSISESIEASSLNHVNINNVRNRRIEVLGYLLRRTRGLSLKIDSIPSAPVDSSAQRVASLAERCTGTEVLLELKYSY